MKKKQVLICLLLAGMAWTPAMALAAADAAKGTSIVAAPDNNVVKGTVTDADGPLIGATVKVAGTTSGTVTDFDGLLFMAVFSASQAQRWRYLT